MKKIIVKMMSFILILSMMSTTTPVFASEAVETKYSVVKTDETPYGTVFYVKEDNVIQPRSFWDVIDILMAGSSWAKLFSDPSWGNFGWAVLDTAALLPVLPSSAYFREGGKVLLKVDEVAKFAKTSAGKKAISAAMKTYKYSDGITSKATKEISKTFKGTEGKKVLQLFKDAADKGIVGSTSQAGIKAITPSKKIGTQYTHEIKIKNSQYGDYRIFGYKSDSGEWVFDLFRRGLHK